MRPEPTRSPSRPDRRGVTLVEMLVAVALLVLMMSVIVTVFASATGSIQGQRAYNELDQKLRRIETVIRQDLRGVTARMTPTGVDPRRDAREPQLGYFEYVENSFADAQGEDTDDTLRFTAKAPDGQAFEGRVWVPANSPNPAHTTLMPITVRSQYAEIIYFLRNGNLYRRVLLIDPARQTAAGNIPDDPPVAGAGGPSPLRFGFQTTLFDPAYRLPTDFQAGSLAIVGWLGMNDLSARPAEGAVPATLGGYAPRANALADLSDRDKRAFSPRRSDDFFNLSGATPVLLPDGAPDDRQTSTSAGDGVADFNPVLYPNIFSVTGNATLDSPGGSSLVNATDPGTVATLFGGGPPYSSPIHFDVLAFPYIYPNSYSVPNPGPGVSNPIGRIHSPTPTLAVQNHAPLVNGDSLEPPAARPTFWGFPTWRETASAWWMDPIKRINDPAGAPYFAATGRPTADEPYTQSPGLSYLNTGPAGGAAPNRWWLSPLTASGNDVPFDGYGTATFNAFNLPEDVVWEDDLILTNVRSFDVKAYDPNATIYSTAGDPVPAGYYDLGYAATKFPGLLAATGEYDLRTLGHEGRIPPLVADNRADAQYPSLLSNLGDDNESVVRMRRVWDSWSTTYSNNTALPVDPVDGPLGGRRPVMPSYPAPYPVPLRGLKIQVRVTDPGDQRIKTLTITQDFTDKL